MGSPRIVDAVVGCYVLPGTGTATTSSPVMSLKSAGLQVYSGSSFAIAVAAIIAWYERAVVFRPERRSDAATWPNARSSFASKGSGSKSASAC